MGHSETIWTTPAEFFRNDTGDGPAMIFAPSVLHATARRFLEGFPGLVTYAVKANPDEAVVANLSAAGIRGFDVASPAEMELVRRLAPHAAMHYNNPVRSRAEIRRAVALGVTSYAVDEQAELDKLIAEVPARDVEVAVRFKLQVKGAAYDFGAKFGATPEPAACLLRAVRDAGFTPSLTFHPGTQCTQPDAWASYIHAAERIAREADVPLARLNVGGGFPAQRSDDAPPDLERIFDVIRHEVTAAFGARRPALVCEPGRGLVAECCALLVHVKALRGDGSVFLDDGIYGALAELPLMGCPGRIEVFAPDGRRRSGALGPRVVFGPTCDSVDRLPGTPELPQDTAEGDVVMLRGMGAYSTITNTRFNGYGALRIVTALGLGD